MHPQPVILVVMGVSGSGKSTLAAAVADRLGWALQEGDDLHPQSNRERMAAGHPLTDAERAPWLARVSRWIDDRLRDGQSGVITCSALKRSYRDVLRRPGVRFVHLHGPRAVLADRLRRRQGHFMPAALLESQLATLELPTADEHAIDVDVRLDLRAQTDLVIGRVHTPS